MTDDEVAYDREFKRMIIIRKFETDDVKSLDAYTRAKHPDAVSISFDRVNKLVRILKPSGSWVTLALSEQPGRRFNDCLSFAVVASFAFVAATEGNHRCGYHDEIRQLLKVLSFSCSLISSKKIA